ncbi:ABC-2 type transporter-domain-containing protein [Papiliotrema laurentii]|uniref:ABC-2 type transporter-domain-containing protein n=1 Tax=Papiliotrema laurentii TaxID=5418 RepID=A0AAD9CR80_PAPLA|nr:ABC-2 type transporter-domain-containing protein [Papiliotrema laurentii]KAK1920720.1 ABC-2 type transporter-domain-containing protein [Papiliotrema laurentii]
MIDLVSGSHSQDRDWAQAWLDSPQPAEWTKTLEMLNREAGDIPSHFEEDEYATRFWDQVKLVCWRASVQRDTEYVINKILLHITVALLIGFSYWNIGNTYADLQDRMFALFNFIFVAPGVMVQTQPKFVANRDIFEKREKKAKVYSWKVFCIGEIVAELPWLVLCAVLFWCCWYPTAGLDLTPGAAGPVVLTMFFCEMLYTGMAQFSAAYAPNPPAAALFIPVLIATLVTFSGVLVPYSQLNVFWRYWMYYVDPFNYLLGALMTFTRWDSDVVCKVDEYGGFDPPDGFPCAKLTSERYQQL